LISTTSQNATTLRRRPSSPRVGSAIDPRFANSSMLLKPESPCFLFSAGGGDNFQRFSGAGRRGAWEPGSSDPIKYRPTARLHAAPAGAGSGCQIPRTRSHRLTHQSDGPLAATHRVPDSVKPRRHVGPMAAIVASSRLRPPDCQGTRPTPSLRDVAPFGKRSDRGDPLLLHLSQILCLRRKSSSTQLTSKAIAITPIKEYLQKLFRLDDPSPLLVSWSHVCRFPLAILGVIRNARTTVLPRSFVSHATPIQTGSRPWQTCPGRRPRTPVL